MDTTENTGDGELTEKQEAYAQWRASGLSKTRAAALAFETKNPRQVGYMTELKEAVKERIMELKAERAESAGLDYQEQVRRYNELYHILFAQQKYALAAKMLERIDAIGGFEAPKKSISIKSPGDALKNASENIEAEVKKFSGILEKHTDKVLH